MPFLDYRQPEMVREGMNVGTEFEPQVFGRTAVPRF